MYYYLFLVGTIYEHRDYEALELDDQVTSSNHIQIYKSVTEHTLESLQAERASHFSGLSILNGTFDTTKLLVKDINDTPYLIDRQRILKIHSFRGNLYFKQIIDLGSIEVPKGGIFASNGSLALNVDENELHFLRSVYPDILIEKIPFGRNHFAKLTDGRKRILINDSEGRSFFLKNIKTGQIDEYSLSLFTHYFVGDNISLMLKKHVKKDFLYLFFGSKLIVSSLRSGKVLKVIRYQAEKILISEDEMHILVKDELGYTLYDMNSLQVLLIFAFDRRIIKFDIKNRINGEWIIHMLDFRKNYFMMTFFGGDNIIKKLWSSNDVVDFVATSEATYLLSNTKLTKYSF